MTTFKCKRCGGNIIAGADQSFGTCEDCGCVVTLPNDRKAEPLNDFSQQEPARPSSVGYVPGVESLHKRAVMFLEDGDFIQAQAYFNRILDIDPEYAPAYIGKLCAGRRLRSEADRKKNNKSLAKDANYQKACALQMSTRERFADEHQRAIYESYNSAVNKNQSAANEQKKQARKSKGKQRHNTKSKKLNRKLIVILAAVAVLLIAVLAFFAVRIIKDVKFDRSYAVGKYVTFGTYPQTESGTDETPIEWRVLDRDGDQALLISRYGLDVQSYNNKYENITWQESSIRIWLNNDFINRAFSDKERTIIQLTNVDNSDSQGFEFAATVLGKTGYASPVSGGNNTQDKIFLLSYAEANRYLNVSFSLDNCTNTESRIAPTQYAIAQGSDVSGGNKTVEGEESGNWWLRSPGNYQNSASCISSEGDLLYYEVYMDNICVRPAMWIDISLIPGLTESENKQKEDSIFTSISGSLKKENNAGADTLEESVSAINGFVSGIFEGIPAKIHAAVENGTIWYFVAGAVVLMFMIAGWIVLLIILGKQKRAKKSQTARKAVVSSVSKDKQEFSNTRFEQTMKGTTVRDASRGGGTTRLDDRGTVRLDDGGTIRLDDGGGTERIAEIKSVDLRLAEMRGGKFCDIRSVTVECDNKIIVGRSDTADLNIDDQYVARMQLEITYDGIDVYITDLNSTNGTKLNDMNIVPNSPQKVVNDDKILIGKTTLKVKIYEK